MCGTEPHAWSVLAIALIIMGVQLALCTLAICRLQREVRDLRNSFPCCGSSDCQFTLEGFNGSQHGGMHRRAHGELTKERAQCCDVLCSPHDLPPI